jgi:hypothetical protein
LRRLACLVVLALASACGAPEGDGPAPSAAIPSDDPNTFRADSADERTYAGEWAADAGDCGDHRKLWTIETRRMGVQRERFCVFNQIRVSDEPGDDQVWQATAKCLAAGRQSDAVLFFRLKPGSHEMRVRIGDADAIQLVRCPMRT